MIGNVREWVADWYERSLTSEPVVRGGSWLSLNTRLAIEVPDRFTGDRPLHDCCPPDSKYADVGFRCAMDDTFVNPDGKKYHRAGCHYLKENAISIKRQEAIARGYTPCSVCKP